MFVSFLFISCLPNVSKQIHHGIGENKLSSEHTWDMVSVTLGQLMGQLSPKYRYLLVFFIFLSILVILYVPNVSKKLYRNTGEYPLSAEQRINTG